MLKNIQKKTGLALIAATLLTGCVASDTNAKASSSDEFSILTKYMVKNKMDMHNIMDRKTWIPHAAILAENITDYTVLDIRQGDIAPKNGVSDFEDGHIPGAISTSFKNILKTARSIKAKDNILVVSHDGQDAAAAAVALRLSGYPTTKVLKFGMSGWNNKFNIWSDKQSNFAVKHKNWTKAKASKPKKYAPPVLNTGKKNGKDILAARVDAFLKAGYHGWTSKELLNNPEKVYIVNQGTAKSYGKYGLIKGAQQFNWPTIAPKKGKGKLENYPANRPIAQYCWTGHASITVSSWMKVLGYNASGTLYGTNTMIIDEMTKKKFKKPADLPYVTGK
ncbi:MAG: rhodanese-like domain-containing protein [Campylobacterota bacterium]|nr:rhodanese-like domain-containing protein [Campylobacterota bacterium]